MLKAIQAEDVTRHNHSYQNPLNDINYQHIVSVDSAQRKSLTLLKITLP